MKKGIIKVTLIDFLLDLVVMFVADMTFQFKPSVQIQLNYELMKAEMKNENEFKQPNKLFVLNKCL